MEFSVFLLIEMKVECAFDASRRKIRFHSLRTDNVQINAKIITIYRTSNYRSVTQMNGIYGKYCRVRPTLSQIVIQCKINVCLLYENYTASV